MAWVNEDLARQFSEIADLLRLSGGDRFRVRAYERAADAVRAAEADLSQLTEAEIAEVRGVGPSTAAKISEYLASGRIAVLEDLRARVPPTLRELARLPGLGPKTVMLLNERLGVSDLDGLRDAVRRQRLRDLPGLGTRTEDNLRAALERLDAGDSRRTPLADCVALAEELCERLGRLPQARRVAYAGSLRRVRDTVGDLDLLVAATDPGPVMRSMRSSPLVTRVLAAGDKKASVVTVQGVQADLRAVEPQAWGAALLYFTGSKAHNVRIRERAVRRGLTLNEYGLFRVDSGERLASHSEADVYAALGMAWVPPPLREDTGEVQAAASGALPRVVAIADLRGELHGHSDWSGDGKATLEQMATAAGDRGHAYWAVTDHGENLPMNGVTRERMLQRRRAIRRLQARLGVRLLDAVELNIGADGELDYDEDFLRGFDLCVAGVHTLLGRPAVQQTRRIIAAMEHPAVDVIAHPTGRRLGRRAGYEFDVDAVLDAALRTGTALEVNASPRRLDLPGELARRAVDAGVTLAISCDAHSVGDLGMLRYGVGTAQRGWATPERVLNCRDLDGVLGFVARKRAGARA